MDTIDNNTEFLNPGTLCDGGFRLVLARTVTDDPEMNGCPCYHFEMRSLESDRRLGKLRFRLGDAERELRYLGHLGYEVFPEHRGHRYAARSVGLIRSFAVRHGIAALWINCDSENGSSRRTCEIAGAGYCDTIEVPPHDVVFREGIRRLARYRLVLRQD